MALRRNPCVVIPIYPKCIGQWKKLDRIHNWPSNPDPSLNPDIPRHGEAGPAALWRLYELHDIYAAVRRRARMVFYRRSLFPQKPECLLLFRTLVDKFGIGKIASEQSRDVGTHIQLKNGENY
jgi:hypothetical protein